MLKSNLIYCGEVVCALLFSLSPVYADPAPISDIQILHFLNRSSFGPTANDIDRVRTIGIGAYLEQQLHPSSLPPSTELQSRLSELTTLDVPPSELIEGLDLQEKRKDLTPEERKDLEKREHSIVDELAQAKILRAVLSPAQLQEVMVDFWFNHFNVFAGKGLDKILIGSYERQAIRPYALGKFRDLLGATAHDPAMLFYLDNWLNTDPNSPVAKGKKIGINENYAREIMELHTLGVNNGYTQEDVTTLAHILTGWGLGEGKDSMIRTNFFFDPRRHDFQDKIWLGYSIRGNGQQEVEQVLDVLAQHPSTAKHIAYELAQYFVADEPPSTLVDKLTIAFHSSDGDIAVVLRALFDSNEFWEGQYVQKKFKPPFRYVVSVLRAAQVAPPQNIHLLEGAIGQMGEPLYRCLTPNGYTNTNDQWLNSDALLKRIDFATKIAPLLGNDHASQTIALSLGRTWSQNTLATIGKADNKSKNILLLSSPEFVYY